MFKKETLVNGVRIVTEEIPHVRSVAIGLWVGAGTRDEGEDNQGISHFIEHMLFKGTADRTAKDLAESLEAVGGQLNAFTTKEYTCYYAKILDEDLDLAVDVLSDMYFNSRFEPKEINKEKRVVIEEIKMYEDSPDELIHDIFTQDIWKDHPLGKPILGTTTSIEGMNREKILSFMDKNYTPENLVIAVAGKIDHKQICEKLAPIFGQFQGSRVRNLEVKPTAHPTVKHVAKETEQIQIILGVPGLAQDDPQIYPLHIFNNILGGGLSSRLFQEIREERGMAYSVYSYHSTFVDSGLFAVYAGTSPENSEPVIRCILQELAKLKVEGITQLELERTVAQIKGSLYLSLESVNSRMSRLGKNELCFNRIITLDEVVDKISRVQLADVKALAQTMLDPKLLSLTTIGPGSLELDFHQMVESSGL
ncbi:MAG TPA: pitrilysin family protein [Verrucomicrobiae bacterium]|nr:pitrilysin family protein [Verrucomicrobiae bacterium]